MKNKLEDIIEIKKNNKIVIVKINQDISINDFIKILNLKNPSIINLININLIIDKEKRIAKETLIHIIVKKELIYNLYFFKTGIKLSKKEMKKNDKEEDILSWNSESNELTIKKYIDKKTKNRVLTNSYSSSNIEEREELIKNIYKILEDFDSIGYRIPLERNIIQLENESKKVFQKKK